MKLIKGISTIMLGLLIVAMVACGKDEGVPYREKLLRMSWEKVIEYAQKEGELSWFVWYLQPQFREIAQDFEEHYGIKVTIPEGTFDANQNKALSEKNLSLGSIDVMSYGGDKIAQLYKAELFYGPIDTVIPGMDTRRASIEGASTQGYGLAYWGNQTGLAYDPARITEAELPQTLAQFEQYMQQNPKMLSFCDPNGGGSGEAFVMTLVRNIVPQEYGNELEREKTEAWEKAWKWFADYSDNYVITSSNPDSLTRLSDGEFIITAAWEDHMANLQRQGAISKDLKFYIPEMGMALGAGFASVLKNAPHPAASLVFLHWLTSEKTQTTFNKRMGAAPQNSEADDSYALVPQVMRQYSTSYVPSAYQLEMKKQFIAKVLIQ